MRLNEILIESQDLEEGPLDAIGRGAAKVVGGIAKGAGMLGGIAGGVKKAYQKGKNISTARIAGDNVEEPAQSQGAPTAADINAQGPKGTAPAKQQTGIAAQAAAKTSAALSGQNAAKAGQAMYSQIKANISKLDKKGKQQIMQLLQKSLAQPAAAPAAEPEAGAKAFGAMAQQLGGDKSANTMANTPVSKTNAAPAATPEEPNYNDQTGQASPEQMKRNSAAGKAAAPYGFDQATGKPNPAPAAAPADTASGKLTPQQIAAKTAELKGKRAAGKTTGTAASGFKQYTKDASSQRIVGANRDGSPKIQQIKASKINKGNVVAESFTFYRKK